MSSASDDDADDPEDILRVIQAKIDRENVQTPGSVSVPTTDVFSAGDENEIPSADDPLSAASAEDWEATANRASRDTAASIRDIESFRRRLDDAKRAVDALANSRVSLRELESMSAELGERNAEHERELEEVARLNGISLTREEEPRAR